MRQSALAPRSDLDRLAARAFAIGIERPEPGRQIAAVVNEAVSDALQEVERLLVERLASISLAVLVQTLEERRDPVSV
ncbi:hypothetical protein M0D46_01900 [Xanthomonas prunicola]|uniref:hypothetical protein n=1 Tax=Xanthomonas prunicola TaxID=2053930 RepID=UPI0021B449B3|nr:hypothetical protein [Xanthomonas prunicola]UXA69889.1 hypothetical protein M0D46_01900 [Xanthomonas prunicola]